MYMTSTKNNQTKKLDSFQKWLCHIKFSPVVEGNYLFFHVQVSLKNKTWSQGLMGDKVDDGKYQDLDVDCIWRSDITFFYNGSKLLLIIINYNI